MYHHWDNFNEDHYMNVLTERDLNRSKEEIRKEKDLSQEKSDYDSQFTFLVLFLALLVSMVFLYDSLLNL